MEATLIILGDKFEVDAVFELAHFEEDFEVTDVHFDYVTCLVPVEIRRRADDIDTKLYNLIETALKENFDINDAEETYHHAE